MKQEFIALPKHVVADASYGSEQNYEDILLKHERYLSHCFDLQLILPTRLSERTKEIRKRLRPMNSSTYINDARANGTYIVYKINEGQICSKYSADKIEKMNKCDFIHKISVCT